MFWNKTIKTINGKINTLSLGHGIHSRQIDAEEKEINKLKKQIENDENKITNLTKQMEKLVNENKEIKEIINAIIKAIFNAKKGE